MLTGPRAAPWLGELCAPVCEGGPLVIGDRQGRLFNDAQTKLRFQLRGLLHVVLPKIGSERQGLSLPDVLVDHG